MSSLTQKTIETWDKVLRDFCGCYADADGNRPCDNGVLCDRCMTKEVQETYQSLLKKN